MKLEKNVKIYEVVAVRGDDEFTKAVFIDEDEALYYAKGKDVEIRVYTAQEWINYNRCDGSNWGYDILK